MGTLGAFYCATRGKEDIAAPMEADADVGAEQARLEGMEEGRTRPCFRTP